MLPILLLLADTAPSFTVQGSAETGLTYTLARTTAAQLPQLEQAVAADAAQRCAPRTADAGAFRWQEERDREGRSTGVTGYERRFRCRDRDAAAAAQVDAAWHASPAEEAAAVATARAFLADRDAGRYAAAYAWSEPGALGDAAAFAAASTSAARSAGAFEERQFDKLTWYVNPASAPRPGAYLAIDFHGRYAKLDRYCGYLVLYRRGPLEYAVVREETNRLGKSDATGDRLAQLRAQSGCAA